MGNWQKSGRIFIMLFVLFCLALLGWEKVQAQESLVGAIREVSPSGGCVLRSKGNKQIEEDALIFSLNDDGKSAKVNIEGKDITVNLVKDMKQKRGKDRKERYVWVFQEGMSRTSKPDSEHVKVTVYLTVVGRDENSVRYDAAVKVSKGSRVETVKAEGGCFD